MKENLWRLVRERYLKQKNLEYFIHNLKKKILLTFHEDELDLIYSFACFLESEYFMSHFSFPDSSLGTICSAICPIGQYTSSTDGSCQRSFLILVSLFNFISLYWYKLWQMRPSESNDMYGLWRRFSLR